MSAAMTDRELLELAAKAAGIRVKWEPAHGCYWIELGQGLAIDEWNPLGDDGQALRLALKLGVGVLFDLQDEKVTSYEQEPHGGYHVEFADEQNPSAATRRAIVRAAASMAIDAALAKGEET